MMKYEIAIARLERMYNQPWKDVQIPQDQRAGQLSISKILEKKEIKSDIVQLYWENNLKGTNINNTSNEHIVLKDYFHDYQFRYIPNLLVFG